MGDVSDIGELLSAHRVKAAKRRGWSTTIATAILAVAVEVIRMNVADAEKGAQTQSDVDRAVRMEMKLDAMKDEIHYLSERTTKLEMKAELRRP